MKTRRMLWIIVVALALAAAAVTVGAAGQGTCGSGCNGMKAQESCGAAGGPIAQAVTHQAERPLDRGSVALISRTCPQSGKTMLVLAVRSTGGQPDPAARLTALLDRRPVALVQAKPGIYRGQVALSRGTHQLVVHVAQGVSESSVGFPVAVSTAPAVAPCANADCRCGANCQCGADCKCGTGACQCGESCQCGADCKCSAGQCANAACPCGENCACGPNCNCAEGQCTCPAGGQCQCGETCRCGASGGPASPQAYSGGCTPDGRPEDCPR